MHWDDNNLSLLSLYSKHSIKDTLTVVTGNVRGTISSYYLALKVCFPFIYIFMHTIQAYN